MFRNQRLVKPRTQSLFGALVVTVLAVVASRASPFLGYLVAVSALVSMIVAMFMSSIWPTRGKKENSIAFSFFWGTMIGGIAPFLIGTYSEGGIDAVLKIFAS